MAEKYSRVHRLLKILTLIQSETGWNAERLAEECGTSPRNVYRDLNMLEGAGIPYYFDHPTKGYRIRRDFFMPPVELTLDESLALIALAGRVGASEQIPFMQPAVRAISKIRGRLPSAVRDELADIDELIDIRLPQTSDDEGAKDIYETVRQAIAKRKALRCQYESLSGTGGDEVFLFMPYRLFFGQRAWYAIGHHDARGAVRSLKINRFNRAELTDFGYEIPGDFTLEKHFGKAWSMVRGDTTYEVELVIDPQFADNVEDTHWHDTESFERQDDDSLVFRCEVDGLDEIVWWILARGPHCVVRKPPELVERVKTLAEQVAARYSE